MNEQAKVHTVKSNAARKALDNPKAQAGADFLLVEVTGGWRWELPAADSYSTAHLKAQAEACAPMEPHPEDEEGDTGLGETDEFDALLADMQAMPAQPKEPKTKAAKPAKEPKAAKVHPDLALAMQGVIPKLEVKSAANPSYQKKADALRSLATGGDLEGLKGYQIGGVNTYAKMLRRYRDHLVVAVEALNTKIAG